MTLPGVRDVARPTSPSPTIEEAPDSPRDRRSPTIAASRSIIVHATRARMIALLSKCGSFADLASLDRQGIILIAGGSVRQFSRRETIGPHTVETAISVYPAVGRGTGVASQRRASLSQSMEERRSIVPTTAR